MWFTSLPFRVKNAIWIQPGIILGRFRNRFDDSFVPLFRTNNTIKTSLERLIHNIKYLLWLQNFIGDFINSRSFFNLYSPIMYFTSSTEMFAFNSKLRSCRLTSISDSIFSLYSTTAGGYGFVNNLYAMKGLY